MIEIWKEIKDYEDKYAVSNLGRVKSLARVVNGRHLKERFLKPEITKGGYMRVSLSKDNKTKHFMLHRLVLENFQPIENSKDLQCDRIDFNKQNNCLDNLRWLTPFENNSRKNPERKKFHHSEEAKQKISQKHKKEVRCVETQQASDSLSAAAGGYHWELVNN